MWQKLRLAIQCFGLDFVNGFFVCNYSIEYVLGIVMYSLSAYTEQHELFCNPLNGSLIGNLVSGVFFVLYESI